VSSSTPNTYPAQPMQGVLIAGFVPDSSGPSTPAIFPRLLQMDYRIDVIAAGPPRKRTLFDLFHPRAEARGDPPLPDPGSVIVHRGKLPRVTALPLLGTSTRTAAGGTMGHFSNLPPSD
jgi:hypothetical protein